MKGVENPAQKTSLAMDLFGKSGASLAAAKASSAAGVPTARPSENLIPQIDG